jgi:hypothetical protein
MPYLNVTIGWIRSSLVTYYPQSCVRENWIHLCGQFCVGLVVGFYVRIFLQNLPKVGKSTKMWKHNAVLIQHVAINEEVVKLWGSYSKSPG